MDSALKQRLIGAAVLVLLAVIFLPMLVTGPAPDGSKDMQGVPANVPKAPDANVELQGRDIDFNAPAEQPAAVVAPAAAAQEPVVSEPVATGPSWIVDFAPYATASDAQMVVDALKSAGLTSASAAAPMTKSGKEVHQVVIGPFSSVADAEKARIAAVKVSPVAAKVRKLEGTMSPAPGTATATTKPATPATAPAKPAEAPVAKVEPAAAASDGPYAVQLGAFENEGQADALHKKAAAAGFNTILIKGKDKEGRPVTRVRTAPVSTKQDAEALKAQVSMKLNRTGQVQKL